MHKKRGSIGLLSSSNAQAAMFIIMAIVIVLAGLLYFLYQRESVEEEVEFIEPEAVPVKLYVDNCIKSVALDGLERIGLTGGYIKIPERINNDPRAYFSLFPGSLKNPYWWHDGIEAVPSEEFIRHELENHIKSELRNCISSFEAFAGKFEINELKEPVVDVQFNDNDVSVKLKYPLEIIGKEGNFKALIENFNYVIPIRFKKVFELAKLIMERENKDYFLELRTIDLFSIDREIPTTEVEASCGAKIWQLSNIRNRLQTLLRVNLPYIRIKGTDYDANSYVPNPSGKNVYSQTYFQQHYVWDIGLADKAFKNMKVSFTYDNWPMYIYSRPSDDGFLKSNSQKGTELLSFFCLQISHFTYDVSYPVIVTIFDKETETNKDYQFRLAFEVSVDHNAPNRLSKGTTLFETVDDLAAEEYCGTLQNEITIYTIDNATAEGMRDVNLTFVCGRYYCNIGKSNWLSFGAAAGITTRFPYCINGIIKGVKQGYSESKEFIQTDADGRSYVLALNPAKEVRNYKVVKHLLSEPGIARELSPNEKASILIKGKDNGFSGFAFYPQEGQFQLVLPSLKDSSYDVEIYIVDEENIVGGYLGTWNVGIDALKDADEVVFHAVEQGPASEDEMFLFISGLASYSKNVPAPELR